MKYPVRELVTILVGFVIFSVLLLGGMDIILGKASEQVGAVIAFLGFLPALWLAVSAVGRRPFRQIVAAPTASWRAARVALLVAVPVAAAVVAGGIAMLGVNRMPTPAWVMVLLLVATPVMALAEELLFRGWFPQFFGFWIKNPWVAFFLPVPFFAAIHAPTDAMTWAGHLISGACFAYLALRAQSLAASAVVHATSNLALSIADYFTSYSGGEMVPVILAVKTVLLVAVTAVIGWRLSR